jgi:hypothetical protein
VWSEANTTLLAVTECADLTVRNLHFKSPGGFSISNRGDLDGQGQNIDAGKGIFVDVREDQTCTVDMDEKNMAATSLPTACRATHRETTPH